MAETFAQRQETFTLRRFADPRRSRKMRRMKRAPLFLLLLVLSLSARAASEPALGTNIDSYLKPFVDEHAFSGVVLVAKGDEVIFEKAYGMANYEFAVPNRTDTRFAIASITKRYTGIILQRLVAEKKISMSDTLSKWVPDFPSADKITLEHLRTHYSGLRDPDDLRRLIRMNFTAAEVVEHLRKKPLGGEPGAGYSYTTANYAVLGYVIEKVTGASFADVMQKYIYGPAGMKDSGELLSTTVVPRLASGYMPDPFGGGISVCGPEDMSWKIAGGSSYSTARDLHRFARAWFGGKLGEPPVLSATSKVLDKPAHSTSGSFPGAGANLLVFPEDQLTVVVLTNNYATVATAATQDIAAIYFGRPVPDKRVALAKDPAPMDPKLFGSYEVEARPWTLTIGEEKGTAVVSFNALRKSALRRIDHDTWFYSLDWAKLRLRTTEAGFEGMMIMPTGEELKLRRK